MQSRCSGVWSQPLWLCIVSATRLAAGIAYPPACCAINAPSFLRNACSCINPESAEHRDDPTGTRCVHCMECICCLSVAHCLPTACLAQVVGLDAFADFRSAYTLDSDTSKCSAVYRDAVRHNPSSRMPRFRLGCYCQLRSAAIEVSFCYKSSPHHHYFNHATVGQTLLQLTTR